MPVKPSFLAVDLSANTVDLALFHANGSMVDVVSRQVQRCYDGAHDPQDWWRAVRTGIKDLMRRSKVRKEDIRSIAVTSDDRGLVCLDKEGRSLTPTYVLPHPDIEGYSEELTKLLGARNFGNLVGGAPFVGCAASLALWLREQHPRHWHDCAALLAPKDFLSFRFTEQRSTDPSTAAAMRLLNPRSGAWSKQVLERLEIKPEWLPSISPGHLIAGRVSPTAAKETGLAAGTPVATGANRSACLALAAGALKGGDMVIQLGDNGHIFAIQDSWRKPQGSEMEIGCHTINNTWALLLRDIASDSTIHWYLSELAANDVQQWRRAGRNPMDVVAELAAEVPPGSEGLHFFSANHEHPGGLIGVRSQHKRPHIMRAMLESVGYRVRDALSKLQACHATLDAVHIVGSGASLNLWCQIISDACNIPVRVIPLAHPDAVGCSILAAAAIGSYGAAGSLPKEVFCKTSTLTSRRPATQTYNAHAACHAHFYAALCERAADCAESY